jgi:hypothetical protein
MNGGPGLPVIQRGQRMNESPAPAAAFPCNPQWVTPAGIDGSSAATDAGLRSREKNEPTPSNQPCPPPLPGGIGAAVRNSDSSRYHTTVVAIARRERVARAMGVITPYFFGRVRPYARHGGLGPGRAKVTSAAVRVLRCRPSRCPGSWRCSCRRVRRTWGR